MRYPKVCIIILNWNGKKILEDCLRSLFTITDYKNLKAIVVDNNSTDGSIEFTRKYFPAIDVLVLDKNYGFVIGNNKGMKYAMLKYAPDYILLLNNDTKIIQNEWLKKMVDTAESDKKIGVVGCKMLFPDRRIQYGGVVIKDNAFRNKCYGEPDNGQCDEIENTFFASGASFLLKSDLIKKIGFLDEVYFPFLGEEMDYFFRARKYGFKIVYCGKSEIIHKGGISLKKVEDRKRLFVSTRNALILSFRYYPISMKILEVLKSIKKNLLTPSIFSEAFYTALSSYKKHNKLQGKVEYYER